MADAYSIAQQHLDAALAEATDNNIDPNRVGSALIWKVLEMYGKSGRTKDDIVSEVEFTLENVDQEGIFHVIRN